MQYICNGFARPQGFPCLETLNHSKTAQFTVARGRAVHSLTARYSADCEAKHSWTLYQRGLCSEAPPKGDEYESLPEYTPLQEIQSKLFVIQAKGLPWSCTADDLMSFFSECRIQGGVNGIHMLHDQYGRPSGRAIIELEHEEDVRKALCQHRHYLRNRYVEVFEVTNKDAEALLKAAKSMETDGVVRLKGLPYSCTEEDIIQFFSGLDIVEDGVTLVLNGKGRKSGNAFVEFASKEMAEKALMRDKEVLGNRYIEIFPSTKRVIQPKYGRLQNDTPAFKPKAEDITYENKIVPKHFLHMRGLPFGVKPEDIVKFFAPVRLMKVLIEYGPDGKPTGEGEAYFRTHQDAVLAMSKDREFILERYIELYLNSYAPSGKQ